MLPGLIIILLPVLWHLNDANARSETKLDTLRKEYVENIVLIDELEHQAALASNKLTDEDYWTGKMKERQGIATAYSCEGITTPEEKLMNCPNGLTASGTIPATDRTIACEKSLIGKVVDITFQDGTTLTGHCEDTGGAITKDRIDVYVKDIQMAREFGVKKINYVVR